VGESTQQPALPILDLQAPAASLLRVEILAEVRYRAGEPGWDAQQASPISNGQGQSSDYEQKPQGGIQPTRQKWSKSRI